MLLPEISQSALQTALKHLGAFATAAALSFGTLPASSYAEAITFPDSGKVSDHFFLTKGTASMEFSGGGRLSYLLPPSGNSGGAILALLNENGSDLYTEAERVSISFRLSTGASFGIMAKASDRTAESYLFLVQAGADQRGALRICKLPLLPLSGLINERQLQAHAFAKYDSAGWHQLVLTLKEVEGAVVMEAQILAEDGREVAHLVARDASGALTGKGLLGLRFYIPGKATDGFEDQPPLLEVKDLNVDPAPAL